MKPMSNIQRRKTVRRTTLIYGEGSDDKCWLDYLKEIFAKNKTIKIKNGGGGSPDSVIEKMINDTGFRDYDARVALLDTDRPEFNIAEKLALDNDIHLIPSNGCIELELLTLMHIAYPKAVSSATLKRARTSSKQAKTEFKKVCRHDTKVYIRIFPKNVLEDIRSKSSWLDTILTKLENA